MVITPKIYGQNIKLLKFKNMNTMNKHLENSIICNHVLSTNDYSMFKFLKSNRKLDLANKKRLELSFKKRQLFSPIIVNENLEIIDGQHRFTVCEKFGLPLYYIVVDGYGLKEVQTLNTNSSNWKKSDYLKSYCDQGEIEYIKFRNFMAKFPLFGFMAAEMLLKLNSSSSGSSYKSIDLITDTNKQGHYRMKTFEEGKFVCVDYDKSCDYAEKILQIKPFNSTIIKRTPFISAIIQVLNNDKYNHSEFMYKLSLQPNALVDCVNSIQFKVLIEEIYNFKRRDKVNLRF